MKLINVLNDGDIAATIICNEDQVGITLLALKNAVHPDAVDYIDLSVKDSDDVERVIAWLKEETTSLANDLKED